MGDDVYDSDYIHQLIRGKKYGGLDTVFTNQALFALLHPATWNARIKFDTQLFLHACQSAQFIHWLAAYSGGGILCDIADGNPYHSHRENRIYFDQMKKFQHLMSDQANTVMAYFYTWKGYEQDDIVAHIPSFPLSPSI
ncbi:MAG: hypothetical protein A3F17_06490 [Gammaproteobacteria bacterium RIFCSPHIGHO2_12_FULL_41_15]|nr:MAG: hypothetical protein A3F17_06490 [Gammaproteobacteria bacterium RIFCSPHIGHO2_12_FULL_41_15]